MSYTAKAFIKIENRDKRYDLLQLIRNNQSRFVSWKDGCKFVFINEDRAGCWKLISEHIEDDFIDCNHYANGDEEKAIELFLELAKMRNDARINQWFYYISDSNNKKVFGKVCGLGDRDNDSMFIESQIQSKNLIKLSQLELAEAFKQGKINLK